ncbi:MAG: hypothetical protein RI932_1090 [Pseudomonadota bacterium]|jgi:hypothetical protein
MWLSVLALSTSQGGVKHKVFNAKAKRAGMPWSMPRPLPTTLNAVIEVEENYAQLISATAYFCTAISLVTGCARVGIAWVFEVALSKYSTLWSAVLVLQA